MSNVSFASYISYNKLIGRTSLSSPGVELGSSKDLEFFKSGTGKTGKKYQLNQKML